MDGCMDLALYFVFYSMEAVSIDRALTLAFFGGGISSWIFLFYLFLLMNYLVCCFVSLFLCFSLVCFVSNVLQVTFTISQQDVYPSPNSSSAYFHLLAYIE